MYHFLPRASLGLFIALTPFHTAHGQTAELDGVTLQGRYIGDFVYVAEGATDDRTFLVHEGEAAADFDFDAIASLSGLSGSLHLLATAGGRPNDAAGTLQGVDNVEVGYHRAKLYQAWLEQSFAQGRASLRLGLTDLNADFYQNDAAGFLLGPAFGIGSELAATGPNGPSIFPSTALTARLTLRLDKRTYAKVAIINARSGVLGDPEGIDLSMRDGALLIGELGTSGRNGKLALGAWGYTQRQDDIYLVGADGNQLKRTAAGVYLLGEYRLTGNEEAGVDAFLRVGRSDGATTPFQGGFQAGFLMKAPFRGRPEGQLSLGIQQGELSKGFRRLLLEHQGVDASASEWGLELTYSDKLAPFLTLQPDLQFIRRSYAEDEERSTFVLTIRTTIHFGDS